MRPTVTRRNLDVLEGRLQTTKGQQLDNKPTLSRYTYFLPLNQSADAAESAVLSAFLNADPPSAACNHCGVEGVELLKCGRCRRAFDFSAACQSAAWRNHKADCRKKVFLPGDLIKITTAPADVGINPVGNVSCNGYILEIFGKTAQRDDYWNVRSVGSDCSGHALQDSRFVFWLLSCAAAALSSAPRSSG